MVIYSMSKDIDMNKHKDDIAYFLTFCVEIYKNAHSLSGVEALALLSDSGALKYLEENYDVIHTQSHHWILADIEEYLSTHK